MGMHDNLENNFVIEIRIKNRENYGSQLFNKKAREAYFDAAIFTY
jgi:hypothetical protein